MKNSVNNMMPNGWLEPDGTYHGTAFFAQHDDDADVFIEDLGLAWDREDELENMMAYEFLERLGWIRIQHAIPLEPDHIMGEDLYVTKEQYKTIQEIMENFRTTPDQPIRIRG